MGKAEMVVVRTDVLAKLIADSGLTKRAFSAKFGFSESWIGGILRDGRIKPMTAHMIAEKFGIPYEALVIAPDSPIVKGAGLTSLEVEAMLTKVEEAMKLVHEVKEVLTNAR